MIILEESTLEAFASELFIYILRRHTQMRCYILLYMSIFYSMQVD